MVANTPLEVLAEVDVEVADWIALDLGKLASSSWFPGNGVIYVADERSVTSSKMNGFTLSNATDIGNPLTVASNDPVYVEGDYNTTDISEHELRNLYLRPFKAAVDAGVKEDDGLYFPSRKIFFNPRHERI